MPAARMVAADPPPVARSPTAADRTRRGGHPRARPRERRGQRRAHRVGGRVLSTERGRSAPPAVLVAAAGGWGGEWGSGSEGGTDYGTGAKRPTDGGRGRSGRRRTGERAGPRGQRNRRDGHEIPTDKSERGRLSRSPSRRARHASRFRSTDTRRLSRPHTHTQLSPPWTGSGGDRESPTSHSLRAACTCSPPILTPFPSSPRLPPVWLHGCHGTYCTEHHVVAARHIFLLR